MSNSRRSFLQNTGRAVGLFALMLIPGKESKSAAIINTVQKKATLETKIFFPADKSYLEIVEELKSCTDSLKIEEVFNEFFSKGKIVSRNFRKTSTYLEYKIVFDNHNSLREYNLLMNQKNIVNSSKQKTIGYSANTQVV
jgi:hypothetical protein